MKGFERVMPSSSESPEEVAEKALEGILADPEHAFLNEITTHRKFLEECDSAVDALVYAKEKIKARLERSTTFKTINTLEGVRVENVDVLALRDRVLEILEHQFEIGRGGDAFVVVDKNEIDKLPPEICYKFALVEQTPRGRNTAVEEACIQGEFYDAALLVPDSKIGVPAPFYVMEVGSHKVIAMEKLPAVSIDGILRGKGSLPENFDIESFCEELSAFLDHMHEQRMYHRDMHFGNVMITQKPYLEEGDKWGYVIDFGLSDTGLDADHAYVRERVAERFTYNDDYGIISSIKSSLMGLKNREAA